MLRKKLSGGEKAMDDEEEAEEKEREQDVWRIVVAEDNGKNGMNV